MKKSFKNPFGFLTFAVAFIGFNWTAQAEVNDFHSLINESIAAKEELSQKLKNKVPNVADRKANNNEDNTYHEAPDLEAENVVVPSRGVVANSAARIEKTEHKRLDSANSTRLSQEVNDAQ